MRTVSSTYLTIRSFIKILPDDLQHRFQRGLAVMVCSALMEMMTLAGLYPFLALVIEPDNGASFSHNIVDLLATHLPTENMVISVAAFYLLWVIGSFVLAIFVTMYRSSLIRDVKNYCVAALMNNYLHQPMLYHNQTNSSRLISTICEDTTQGIDISLQSLLTLVTNLILVAAIGFCLLILMPNIALIAGTVLGACFIFLHLGREHKLKADGTLLSELLSRKILLITESLTGIKEVKVYNLEDQLSKQLMEVEQQINTLRRRIVLTSFFPRQVVEFLVLLVAIGGFLFLSMMGDNPRDHMVEVSISAFAILRLFPPLNLIFVNINLVRDNIGNIKKVNDDLQLSSDEPKTTGVRSTSEPPIRLREAIRLKTVGYQYEGQKKPVLDKVNLTIPAGTMFGIAGDSGSGKSTLVQLLLGLIEPDSGAVFIDNSRLSPEQWSSWNHLIGYVPQDMHLLDATILENITLGNPGEKADHPRLQRASERAGIAGVIDDLPHGYNTRIGERGVLLSGGQRQRLAIARALYRQPEVLILDEATSALDEKTEASILQTIADLSPPLTVIVVSHRHSALQYCSNLFDMNSNRVSDRA